MSKYIDADLYVEMQIYDDEHEEWGEWQGTIEDLLNQWTEQGCPSTIEVSEDCISREYLEEQLQQIEDITAMAHIDLGEDPYDETEEITIPISTVRKIFKKAPSVVPRLDKEDLEDIKEHIRESYMEGKAEGEDWVRRKDFEDVVKRMGERNCFTCGVYHEGEWVLMARNPEEVTAEELEESDRAVSLAEVCKIIQDTYEVCPATWGRLRNLPSVVPTTEQSSMVGEWITHYETYEDSGETVPYGVECPFCGRWEENKEPFCNCGAKMKV